MVLLTPACVGSGYVIDRCGRDSELCLTPLTRALLRVVDEFLALSDVLDL